MEREILFRGKRITDGEWVYGSYACYSDADGEYHMILEPGNDEPCCSDVDPETVGQYTGCLDKDGRRIFEGDILLSLFDDVDRDGKPIVYRQYSAVFWSSDGAWNMRTSYGAIDPDPIGEYVGEDCAVVGNVYDNPKLMEEADEA